MEQKKYEYDSKTRFGVQLTDETRTALKMFCAQHKVKIKYLTEAIFSKFVSKQMSGRAQKEMIRAANELEERERASR